MSSGTYMSGCLVEKAIFTLAGQLVCQVLLDLSKKPRKLFTTFIYQQNKREKKGKPRIRSAMTKHVS